MKNILLTGNRGYIGMVMASFLKKASYNVVGLDNGWFDRNLFYYSAVAGVDRQISKDIRNVEARDLDGIDAVIHLAALSNDPLGELDPGLTDEINNASTLRLAGLCKERGVRRFIFSSSCSIYGISSSGVAVDENGKANPITAYAKAKVDSEEGLKKLADKSFHPVLMRNATAYGASPSLRLDLVVNNLLAWAYLKGEINILSDGTPWRPIAHLEDICAAFLEVLRAPEDKVSAQAFNIGSDSENYTVRQIADMVNKALPSCRVNVLNKTGTDERSYKVSFANFGMAFPNFKPAWTLAMGVEQLLSAYRKHGLTAKDFDSGKFFRLKAIESLVKNGDMDKKLFLKGGSR